MRRVPAISVARALFLAMLIFYPFSPIAEESLRATTARDRSMTFEQAAIGGGGNCDGCAWIAAQGRIVSETPQRFRNFLERNEIDCRDVKLNSPGGSPEAAMLLGRIFREKGCTTSIGATSQAEIGATSQVRSEKYTGFEEMPGSCESACALAFLGGKVRYVEAGDNGTSDLGVHQFTVDMRVPPDVAEQALTIGITTTQLLQGLIIGYVADMGANPLFAQVAANTPASQIHYFSQKELTDLKLATFGSQVGSWKIVPYRSGAVATSEVSDGEKIETRTLFCESQPQLGYFALFSRHWRQDYVKFGMIGPIKYQLAGHVIMRLDQEKCSRCQLIHDKAGRKFFKIPIPADIVLGYLSGSEILISVPLSHAEGRDFEFNSRLSADDRALLELVMRNCI